MSPPAQALTPTLARARERESLTPMRDERLRVKLDAAASFSPRAGRR